MDMAKGELFRVIVDAGVVVELKRRCWPPSGRRVAAASGPVSPPQRRASVFELPPSPSSLLVDVPHRRLVDRREEVTQRPSPLG